LAHRKCFQNAFSNIRHLKWIENAFKMHFPTYGIDAFSEKHIFQNLFLHKRNPAAGAGCFKQLPATSSRRGGAVSKPVFPCLVRGLGTDPPTWGRGQKRRPDKVGEGWIGLERARESWRGLERIGERAGEGWARLERAGECWRGL